MTKKAIISTFLFVIVVMYFNVAFSKEKKQVETTSSNNKTPNQSQNIQIRFEGTIIKRPQSINPEAHRYGDLELKELKTGHSYTDPKTGVRITIEDLGRHGEKQIKNYIIEYN